jgi:hypothetical protein
MDIGWSNVTGGKSELGTPVIIIHLNITGFVGRVKKLLSQ